MADKDFRSAFRQARGAVSKKASAPTRTAAPIVPPALALTRSGPRPPLPPPTQAKKAAAPLPPGLAPPPPGVRVPATGAVPAGFFDVPDATAGSHPPAEPAVVGRPPVAAGGRDAGGAPRRAPRSAARKASAAAESRAPSAAARAPPAPGPALASLSTPSALPKGFFADKKADAKARGIEAPTEKELTAEYENLLAEVEAGAAAATDAAAAEEEPEDEHEGFVQFVREERLAALREARRAGGAGEGAGPTTEATAEVVEAILNREVEAPVVRVVPRKRVAETSAELTGAAAPTGTAGSSDGGSSDDESSEESGVPDWRRRG